MGFGMEMQPTEGRSAKLISAQRGFLTLVEFYMQNDYGRFTQSYRHRRLIEPIRFYSAMQTVQKYRGKTLKAIISGFCYCNYRLFEVTLF